MDIYIFSHRNRIKYLMESYGIFDLPNTGMIKLVGNSAKIIYPQEELCSSPPVFTSKYNLPSFLTIYLIRHAEGEHNVQSPLKRIYSWIRDPGLTPHGVNQTKKLANKIKEFYDPSKQSIFFASDLHRAQETARIVLSELVINNKIRILPNIGEVIFKNGVLESIVSPFVPENESYGKNYDYLDWKLYFIKTDKHLFDFIIQNLIYLL